MTTTISHTPAAGAASPSTTLTVITPEMAARWLAASNTANRRIRKGRVSDIARDIKAGRWMINGASIKFAADGTILDGQHRLAACVEAGVPIATLLVRGLRREAQATIDTGAARTASDALAIGGHANSAILAAAARLALLVRANDLDNNNCRPTHSEIEDFIDRNPVMVYAAEFAGRIARRTDIPPSVVAYAAFVFTTIDANDAYDFWTAAADKVGLQAGDPVIALTNRFAEARRNRERLTKRAMLSMVFRAWNYRREGKSLVRMKVNSAAGGLIPIPEAR